MDASNMLKPALARGELRCIGATTLDEYRKRIEKDAALERRFQPVFVGEPTRRGHDRHPARAARSATRSTTASASRMRRSSLRRCSAIATSPTASCPTRRSTSSTRPPSRDQDGDRLDAAGDRRGRAPRDAARDRAAGAQEGDATRAASKRLDELEREIAELNEQKDAMRAQWLREKELIGEIRTQKRAGRRAAPGRRARAARGRLEAAARIQLRRHPRGREGGRRDRRTSSLRSRRTAASSRRRSPRRTSRAWSRKWTGIPVSKMLEGEKREAPRDGGAPAQARRRPGGGGRRGRQRRAPRRARASATRIGRWERSCSSARPASARPSSRARSPSSCSTTSSAMIRIDMSEYMEKHTVLAADRRAAGLRRLRGGRPAHRAGAPPAVLRRPVRRDREGAPRRVQRALAGARRRPPHRRAGPHGRLHEHGHHHDEQRRLAAHLPRQERRGDQDAR